jgi:hypothetical protein
LPEVAVKFLPPLLALAFLPALGLPAHAADIRDIREVYSLTHARSVRIELPAGDLRVETVPEHKLRLDLTLKCRGWNYDCDERVRDAEIVGGYEGNVFVLKLAHPSRHRFNGLSLHGTLQVPRDLALDFSLGAGDLDLWGLGADTDVSLGAGDLTVHMKENDTRSVDMQVGLGDASLRRRGENIRGRGFLSKSLSWSGSGRAVVNLHLGVGDVSARLDE